MARGFAPPAAASVFHAVNVLLAVTGIICALLATPFVLLVNATRSLVSMQCTASFDIPGRPSV